MDLLFKNPQYFFKTYFSVPLWIMVMIWGSVFVLICLYDEFNGTWQSASVLWRICSSLCIAIILGTCIFNQSRQKTRMLIINPFPGICMVLNGDIHWIRQVVSNLALYVPFGFCWRMRWRSASTIIFGFLLSAMVESLQFLLENGTSEFLDVLMNTIGTMLGSLILACLSKMYVREFKMKRKNTKG